VLTHFDDALAFGFSTYADFLSWLFLLSLIVKLATTGLGLTNARTQLLDPTAFEYVWWLSKLSALSLCWSASELSAVAGDLGGELFFKTVLVAAAALVLLLGVRRRLATARSDSSA
jgi:hypothetical protein